MPGARVASGERVALWTAEQDDVPFLQRGSTEPDLRYSLGTPVRNQEAIEISDDGSDRFVVCLDGDDAGPGQPDEVAAFDGSPDDHAPDAVRRIGMVAVQDADFKRPELGYWLIPEVHGEGTGKRPSRSSSTTRSGRTTRPPSARRRSASTTPRAACWSRSGSPRRAAVASSCSSTATTGTWCSTGSFERSGATETGNEATHSPSVFSSSADATPSVRRSRTMTLAIRAPSTPFTSSS
jgi:hypothetical protein